MRNHRCDQEDELRLLCDHLDRASPQSEGYWQDWHVSALYGGQNNRLFRVRSSLGDYVIKFTIRDVRNRAEREFQALSALEEAELQIAPIPIFVDTETYTNPVVIQSWIDGDNITRSPSSDEEWKELLQYYHDVHSIRPDNCSVTLEKAYAASTVSEGRGLVDEQAARIPSEAQPTGLEDLVRRFKQAEIPEWDTAPVTLCRSDPNVSNFIRRGEGLASVDWEYSGWGDPTFDIADLMTHPTYMAVPRSRWAWLMEIYEDS